MGEGWQSERIRRPEGSNFDANGLAFNSIRKTKALNVERSGDENG